MSPLLTAQSTPAFENTANGFGAGQVAIVLSLSEPSDDEITVDYRLRDQSAGDDDLLYLSTWFRNFGTLRFAPGETEKTVIIETRPDTRVEPDEAFAVEFYNPDGAAFEGDTLLLQSLGIILDNDRPTHLAPTFFVTEPLVVANDATVDVRFDIYLSRPVVAETVLHYETSGLSGTPVMGTIALGVGDSTASLTLPVATASLPEGLGTLGLKLSSDASGAVPSFSTATLLKPAGDALPTIAVLGDAGLENVGPVDGRLGFTIVLSTPSADPVSVEYYLSSGSADDQDLDAPFFGQSNTGTVTFAPGETVATVQVALQTDSLSEPDESFTFHVINPKGAVFAGGAVKAIATGILRDNDSSLQRPSLFVEDALLRNTDAGPVAEFALFLSRPWDEDVTLAFSTQDGTALAGTDYQSIAGEILIEAGQTRAMVQVPLEEDLAQQTSGRFFLTATIGSETIVDSPVVTGQARLSNCGPGLLPVAQTEGLDVSWVEGQDNIARFVISLSHASDSAVSLPYHLVMDGPYDPTREGHLAASGVAQFEAGKTHKVIEIPLGSNTSPAVDTAVWLEVFDPSGARLDPALEGVRAVSVIRTPAQDIAAPALFLTQTALKQGPSGEPLALLELRLSRPAQETTTVEYITHQGSAVAFDDVTSVSGTIVFEIGQDTAIVGVPAAQRLMISAEIEGSDDPVWTTLTLQRDQMDLPMLTLTGTSVFENRDLRSNELPFVIQLSAPSSEYVSVQYEAFFGTANADDLAEPLMSGTAVFHPGQTRMTIALTTQFDATPEPDETVFLQLWNPMFADFEDGTSLLSAPGFVLDDDGTARPEIAAGDALVTEGDIARIAVHLSRAMDRDATFSIEVTYGSATAADIASIAEVLTFLKGQTTAYLTVSALNDGLREGDEALSLSLVQTVTGEQTPIQTSFSIKINDAQTGDIEGPLIRSGTEQSDVLRGGGFADTLTGMGGDDQLFGAEGDDYFMPGLGSDSIFGGDGIDTISFVDAIQGMSIDMTLGQALSGSDLNVWTGIENITASIHSDYVLTDTGDNRIRALGNYDWIVGSDGFDFIDGGDGRDMLSYVHAPGSVVVDLGSGRGIEGQASGDRFVSIERLTGSIYSDRFLGSDGSDDFRGLGGDDWFVGSDGGRDRYDGGTGRDTVAYNLASGSVTASLTPGIFGIGQAALDLYTSIENLTGSSFDDLLIGDNGRNTLRGLYGADHLEGRGGNDQLIGGATSDVLDGGAGWDVAVYHSNRADYRIDQIDTYFQVTALGSLKDGTDTLIDIEAIQFADAMVFL